MQSLNEKGYIDQKPRRGCFPGNVATVAQGTSSSASHPNKPSLMTQGLGQGFGTKGGGGALRGGKYLVHGSPDAHFIVFVLYSAFNSCHFRSLCPAIYGHEVGCGQPTFTQIYFFSF